MEQTSLYKYEELMVSLLTITGKLGASDLHIIPNCKPTVRLNGEIERIDEMDELTPEVTSELARYITKDMSDFTVETCTEYDFAFGLEGVGRYRVNVYRQRGDIAIAIRVLPLGIRDFKSLGIPDSVKQFSYKNNGLVLVTGPTGSGKSTTLAALLDLVNKNRSCHIITIEDPIEYVYDHKSSIISQREIGRDSNSFEGALRAAMREDPDVILVGEMRDAETIQIALTAAETGHLVFSTLHTVGATKTIDRIVDTFEGSKQNQIRSQLATVLQGVVSQVLVPLIDGKGRTLASEVMFNTPAIRNLIREGRPHQIVNVMQTSKDMDMHLLDDDLARLYRAHIISYDMAINKSQDARNLINLIGERKK
ncbi:MAG: PilT/PilU family type 4a pilus ATPase [Erysipelotrichaceae bacterium]